MFMTPDEKIPFKKTDELPFGFGSKNSFYRLARWLGFSLVFGLLWIVDDYYTASHLSVHMSWIAALIGALASAASAGVGAASTSKMNKRAERFAREENEMNRNFQAEQSAINRTWAENYYNQFESPASMVRQYEEAGLNPALMYGSAGASVGPSASVPSGSTSGSSISPSYHVPDWSSLADAAMQFAQIRNINADTDNKEKEGKRISADTENIISSTELNYVTVDEKRSNIKKNEKELDYITSQISKNRVEMANLVKQGRLAEASEFLSRQQAKLVLSQIGMNDATISKVNAEIAKLVQDVKESKTRQALFAAQTLLTGAQQNLVSNQSDAAALQVGNIAAQTRKLDAETAKIGKESVLLDFDVFESSFKRAYLKNTGLTEPPHGLVGDLYNVIAGFAIALSAQLGVGSYEK